MSLNQFIPSIWSARILAKLQSTLVYGQSGVVNTDYEGEISSEGSEVYVHSFSDVTVNPYTRNSTQLVYEELTDERTVLQITDSDYFGVRVDDLDYAQMRPKIMDAVAQDAAYQLAKKQDTFLAAKHVDAGATLEGDAGAARVVTAANAYLTFVEASVMLDENDIPTEGRYAVVPPWMAGELLADDKYFLKASNQSVLNGAVGQIAGINILKSNRVPTGTSVSNIMIGHPMAISFASQLDKTEGMRDRDSFADLLRGLTLYGAKTIRPEALINLRASRA